MSKFVEVTSTYLKDMPKSVVHCFTGDRRGFNKVLRYGLLYRNNRLVV